MENNVSDLRDDDIQCDEEELQIGIKIFTILPSNFYLVDELNEAVSDANSDEKGIKMAIFSVSSIDFLR